MTDQGSPEARLAGLGIELPEPMAPVATYTAHVRTGSLLFVSGQVSKTPEGLIRGRLGQDLDLEAGQVAARWCGLALIAQFKDALADLGRVQRIVKLGGFVNASPGFLAIPDVINGCSDLMVDVFGDRGRHARSAVACPELPLGVAVEVDAVIEVS